MPATARIPPLALALAALLAALPGAAPADCACRCVGGAMRAVCSDAVELAPLCPPAICPLAPPSVRPVESPMIAPVGASDCRPRQVLDPVSLRYEWRTLCR